MSKISVQEMIFLVVVVSCASSAICKLTMEFISSTRSLREMEISHDLKKARLSEGLRIKTKFKEEIKKLVLTAKIGRAELRHFYMIGLLSDVEYAEYDKIVKSIYD